MVGLIRGLLCQRTRLSPMGLHVRVFVQFKIYLFGPVQTT